MTPTPEPPEDHSVEANDMVKLAANLVAFNAHFAQIQTAGARLANLLHAGCILDGLCDTLRIVNGFSSLVENGMEGG
jgi:hypothetical protein